MPPCNTISLPPLVGKWKLYEQKALQIRCFAGLTLHEPLDPFKLAETLQLKVISPGEVRGLSEESLRALQSVDQNWSGVTMMPFEDGSRLIIINPRQSQERRAVTLMEEICHVLLGHKLSKISLASSTDNARTYHEAIEEEAYSVGAAALLPYESLALKLSCQKSFSEIAKCFGVTSALVKYRIRVLPLSTLLKLP